MTIVRQKTAFGPGKYRGRDFTRERLQEFVDGTNAAIAAGVPIPLLRRHAKINASDEETLQFSKEEGAGWVKKVWLDKETGAIAWEADDVPESDQKDITTKRVKFSSPEFRPHYESELEGVYSGPMIRHFAFTPKPGNPKQGEMEVIALSENEHAWQFAEDERMPLNEDLGDDKNAEVEVNADTQRNPDMPPKATDATKLKAIIAGMAQLGVVLPSTFDLCDDSAPDLMITGLNTAIKAKNDAEAEAAEDAAEDEPPTTEAAMPFSELYKKDPKMPMQFSEEELAGLPESVRKKLRKHEEAAAQFEEQRVADLNARGREDAESSIQDAVIPAGLKTKLLEAMETAQFAEGEEQPMYTASQVAEMVAESLPPGLLAAFTEDGFDANEPDSQFREQGLADTESRGKPIHVSAERARELASKSPLVVGSPRRSRASVSDLVDRENAIHPNNAYSRGRRR